MNRLKRILWTLLIVATGCGGGGDTSGPSIDPVVISTTALADGVRGVPYYDTLVATGGVGTASWTIVGGALPAGLTLSSPPARVYGTPPVVGSSTFTMMVTRGSQSATRQLSIDIDERPSLQPTESCSDKPWYAIAAFEDPALRARVREAASLALTDDLTCQVVAGLINPLHTQFLGIASIVGVQNLVGLTELYLNYNDIVDVGSVAGLTGLRKLVLDANGITSLAPVSGLTGLTFLAADMNAIASVTPLSGLTALDLLSLGTNAISDLQPLSGLVNLTWLDLRSNNIASLVGLSGLTKLERIYLNDNAVTDITILASLTTLNYIGLENNAVSIDLQPLLNNVGLGNGDTVVLNGTSVNCSQVDALRARGVNVPAAC